jgi:glutaredoxin
MSTDKEIVVYSRTTFCPYIQKARRVFDRHGLSPHEIMTDKDPEALERVLNWTGYKSVPTILVANPGEVLPYEEPAPLAQGSSPRGIDRGSMITEPYEQELEAWLRKHGFIEGA